MKKIYQILAIIGLVLVSTSYGQEKKVQEVEPLGTTQQVVRAINELIKYNDTFSVKLTDPVLPAKVLRWQRQGVVPLPTDKTWDSFKKDIYQFGTQLRTLLEKDKKNMYYHIEAVRKDHPLYQALMNMKQKLISQQPMPEQQKIQDILGIYATSFYSKKLLELLNGFFKKFEPEAKKIRSKAEQLEKGAGAIADTSYTFDDYSWQDDAGDTYEEESFPYEPDSFGDTGTYDLFDPDDFMQDLFGDDFFGI